MMQSFAAPLENALQNLKKQLPDKVDVPPKKVPYFKPGKELKELINKEPETPVQAPPAASGSDLAGV